MYKKTLLFVNLTWDDLFFTPHGALQRAVTGFDTQRALLGTVLQVGNVIGRVIPSHSKQR